MVDNLSDFWDELCRRYAGADLDAFLHTLVPVHIPILSLDKVVQKVPSTSHFAAEFTIPLEPEWLPFMKIGCTGKFVPASHIEGGEPWREIAKGRIAVVNRSEGVAKGEIYVGSGNKGDTDAAVASLTENDYLEIDRYGASAKILSSLVEHALGQKAVAEGFEVVRMPEDVARHLGAYYHYDFEFTRGPETKRVEVKSLWGTNTRYARLIASRTKRRPTSSPRFDSQDIFAVSLFLRTGNIRDFAFALSVSETSSPHGLPHATGYEEHVHQNPVCTIDDVIWFDTISAVWDLDQ